MSCARVIGCRGGEGKKESLGREADAAVASVLQEAGVPGRGRCAKRFLWIISDSLLKKIHARPISDLVWI